MRIGIDLRGIQTFPDGIGRYTRSLVRSLLDIDRENEYVLFKCPRIDLATVLPPRNSQDGNLSTGIRSGSSNTDIAGRVEVVDFPHRHLSPGTVLTFGRTVRASRVDILHVPFFVGPLFCPVPTIVTVHDLMALTFRGFFSGRSRIGEKAALLFHRLFVPPTVRKAALVLADSEFTKSEIIRVLGVPGDRIEVVYPGLDRDLAPVTTGIPSSRILSALRSREPYFAYLGNTKPYKNIPGLLRGFAHAFRHAKGKRPSLVLVGPSDRFQESVESEAGRLGIRDSIFLTGSLEDEEAALVLVRSVGFCFPSLSEGFGLPVLEAMSLGVPVVTSNVTSLPEVVGDAGISVDPSDPQEIGEGMLRLLNDPDLRQRLSEKGIVRAGYFTERKMGEKILSLYNKVHTNMNFIAAKSSHE